MRTPYTPPDAARSRPAHGGRAAETMIQLGTLAYWLPCLCVDIFVLWGWRGQAIGYAWVFHALLREAVVFLVLWTLVGASVTLLFARSTETRRRGRGARRTRDQLTKLGDAALGRDHRGI